MDIGLFLGVTTHYGVSAPSLLLATLIPSLVAAGAVALAAYVIQRRRGSLTRLKQDLTGFKSMMESDLIDSEEYHRLKTRIIDEYQPQRLTVHSVVKPALWGALVSALIPLLLAGSYTAWPTNGFVMATLVPGASAAMLTASGAMLVHRLQQRRWHPELPAGEPTGWQALGTRQSLPSKK